MKKLFVAWLLLICSQAYAIDFSSEFFSNASIGPSEWLHLSAPHVYRLVDRDPVKSLDFVIRDYNSQGNHQDTSQLRTNVFIFWLTPDGKVYDVNGQSRDISNLPGLTPYLSNWNSTTRPMDGTHLNLHLPPGPLGKYTLYVLTTDSTGTTYGNMPGVRYAELQTVSLESAEGVCSEIQSAKQTLHTPGDILSFYHSHGMTYKSTKTSCEAGNLEACFAVSPCTFLKRGYGMCQDYSVFAALILEGLGYRAKVINIRGPKGGHAVTVFVDGGKFYMFDNQNMIGPASTLQEILDMGVSLPSYNEYYIMDAWWMEREGIWSLQYTSRANAASVLPSNF